MQFRLVSVTDSLQILAIYSQYINTPVTFENVLPGETEFEQRIADIASFYPYLIAEEDNKIIAYAYAHRHMERDAYQWNAELSVYIDNAFHNKGLGTKLYAMLMRILKLQGIKTVYAGVTMPNPSSQGLHKSMGFTALGTYHNAGYKNSKWHDVIWYEKNIGTYDIPPAPIVSIQHITPAQLQNIIKNQS